MERKMMTRDDLLDVIWPDPDKQPDYWYEVFKVMLSKLRKKTRPFGFDIRQIREGRGNPGFYCHWRMADRVV